MNTVKPLRREKAEWLTLALVVMLGCVLGFHAVLSERNFILANEDTHLRAQAHVVEANLQRQLESVRSALESLRHARMSNAPSATNRSIQSLRVNVSARQMRQSDFVSQVTDTLVDHAVDPRRLRLELTESMLFSDTEEVIEKMNALRALGVRFSLDDFGTGYSSLSYLKRLPLGQLKIDRSFIREALTNASDATIATHRLRSAISAACPLPVSSCGFQRGLGLPQVSARFQP